MIEFPGLAEILDAKTPPQGDLWGGKGQRI